MNSLLAWSLSQGANSLNVIAGIIVAHLVSPYEFARFATLSAALAIMLAVLNPIINEIAQRVALHRVVEVSALRARTIFALLTCCTIGVCACASIVTTWVEALVVYLLLPVVLVGHSWASGIFFGLHRMIAFGAVLCVGGIFRVATLLGLISLGVVFSGITTSYLVSFIITIVASRSLFAEHTTADSQTVWATNWKLIIGFFLLALPFSVDQPIVHALFPEVSADYAALMTYGRSVMLLASPALALVYSASLQRTSPASQAVSAPLLIATGLAGGLALILWGLYPFLFPLLLGTQYTHVTAYLAPALTAMVLHVVAYFLIQRMLLSCQWWLCIALAIPPLVQGLLLASQTSPQLTYLVTVSFVTFALQCLIACGTTFFSRAPTQLDAIEHSHLSTSETT